MTTEEVLAGSSGIDRGIPVRRVSTETAIHRLNRALSRMERIYEMTSSDMAEALEKGERNETAEISIWMIQFRELQYLTR